MLIPILAALSAGAPLTAAALHVPWLQEGAPPSADVVRGLFVEHCARCHGESGDGKGVTELDRPARSFLDGGFSYGNTRSAVVRSIEHGIPGTPMPAFKDDVVTEKQREALADFVIALGPPGTVVVPGASVMHVTDRPALVRGMLPPLAKGLSAHPRGLLIGFPNGTTFEYRADDVRLLAVRQGDFVDRRDWGGRGGRPLKPLGRVVERRDATTTMIGYLDNPSSHLSVPMESRLRSTEIDADAARVIYDIYEATGEHSARVTETLRTIDLEKSRGYTRQLQIDDHEERDQWSVRVLNRAAPVGVTTPVVDCMVSWNIIPDGHTYELTRTTRDDGPDVWHFMGYHPRLSQVTRIPLDARFFEAVLVPVEGATPSDVRDEILGKFITHPGAFAEVQKSLQD